MSIVSLASNDSLSILNGEELQRLAAELGFTIADPHDAQSYLLLLKSFEAVMFQVDAGDDYVHPALSPVPTTKPRSFWKPDAKDNPLNAWSHRCDIAAAQPTSNLLRGAGTSPSKTMDGSLSLSPIDATVVSRLLRAGALIKGPSTCENFCASPLACTSVTGPVHHPLLHGYTTGGSSSSSCALVSSDALHRSGNDVFGETAELAIGGDQAGSIRILACYTGIYGLKPTFGLVPYTGAASMTPMIDHLGPIASSIEDIAMLLKLMAGWDGIDPRMTPETPLVANAKDYPALVNEYRQTTSEPGQSVLRIGLLTESFGVAGLSQQVCELVRKAAREGFEAAGATVVDISVPMHSEGPIIWTAATRPSMALGLLHGKPSGHLSYLSPHIQTQWRPNQDTYQLLTQSNPAVVNILLSQVFDKSHLAASIEAKAHRKVFQLRTAYDAALAQVDVLVTPCAPTVSMPHPDPGHW
ncbi:amidase [Colletotrichum graminicola M1.001]|uniref:Amidase n=1 Tax=Colletotrichum graminicola (strain M1.001 / M2 / FGSC 10212) TaxID=645133 RepID=E3QVR0_COLGM|nr:amidase [Colletotrichum graminicola M1.001]EFQ34948.1 amidase [Colletotrichum graminicola M1.001]